MFFKHLPQGASSSLMLFLFSILVVYIQTVVQCGKDCREESHRNINARIRDYWQRTRSQAHNSNLKRKKKTKIELSHLCKGMKHASLWSFGFCLYFWNQTNYTSPDYSQDAQLLMSVLPRSYPLQKLEQIPYTIYLQPLSLDYNPSQRWETYTIWLHNYILGDLTSNEKMRCVMQSHLPFVNVWIIKYPLGLIVGKWNHFSIHVGWIVLILVLTSVKFKQPCWWQFTNI